MGGAARVARAIWDLLRARGFARTLGATMVTLGGALVIGSTFFGWATLLGVFSLYGVAFWEGSVAAAPGFLVIVLGAGMLFVDRRTLRRCCALGALLIGSLLVILSIATLLLLDQSSSRVLLDCFEERRLGCPAGIPGGGRPLTESERAEIRNDIAGEPVSGPGLDGLGIVSAVILVGGTIGVASDRLTSRYPDPANDSDVEPTAALRRALSELSVTTGTAGIGAATFVAVGGGVVAATFVRPWVLLEDGGLAFRMFGVLFREGGIAFCLGLGVVPAGLGMVLPSNRSLRRFMALGSMLTGVALAIVLGRLLLDVDARALEVFRSCTGEDFAECPTGLALVGEGRGFSSPNASLESALIVAAVASGLVLVGGAFGVIRERASSKGSGDAPDRMTVR